MPYLIRAKGRRVLLRDGTKKTDPVYEVGTVDWVPFKNLPNNTPVTGDGDLDVREVVSLADAKTPEPYKAPPPRMWGKRPDGSHGMIPISEAAVAVPEVTAPPKRATLASTRKKKGDDAEEPM